MAAAKCAAVGSSEEKCPYEFRFRTAASAKPSGSRSKLLGSHSILKATTVESE